MHAAKVIEKSSAKTSLTLDGNKWPKCPDATERIIQIKQTSFNVFCSIFI